jgi:hypothetical protein
MNAIFDDVPLDKPYLTYIAHSSSLSAIGLYIAYAGARGYCRRLIMTSTKRILCSGAWLQIPRAGPGLARGLTVRLRMSIIGTGCRNGRGMASCQKLKWEILDDIRLTSSACGKQRRS